MQELPLYISCRRHNCKAQFTINTYADRQGFADYLCVDNGWALVRFEGCDIGNPTEDYFVFCPDCAEEAKSEAQAEILKKEKHNKHNTI